MVNHAKSPCLVLKSLPFDSYSPLQTAFKLLFFGGAFHPHPRRMRIGRLSIAGHAHRKAGICGADPKIAGIFRGFITFFILIHTKFGWFHWNFTHGSVNGLKSQFGPCLQPVPTIQVLPSQKSSVPISDVISHPTCDHIPRNHATQAREKALAAVATASRTRAQGALSIGQLATWDMKKTGSSGTLSHFEVKVRLSTGKPSPSKYQKHGKLRSHFFEWKNWEKKHAHSKIGINTHFRSKKKCSNFTEDWDKWNGMGHPKIGLGRCF